MGRAVGLARRAAAILISVSGLTAEAEAAGFAIREQSGTALGNAFAGATAGAEDISYMFFNPAGLTRHDGHQVAATASYVAPHSEMQSGTAGTVVGVPIAGGLGGDDLAENAIVPAFYAMLDLHPDIRLGLGINAPFGLITEYEDGWIGRYHAQRSELKNIIVNPVVAYRVNDWFSVGGGLQASYVDGELTNAIDVGTIDTALFGGAFGGTPTQNDGKSILTGDDWGFGFNLGILLEPWEGTRFGLAYRSKISHELTGDAKFELDSVGTLMSQATGLFRDTGAKLSTELPETVSFGVHHDINAQFSVMAEAAWTRWSRFQELRVRFDNPAQSDNVTDESWESTWFVAAGVTYRPNETWAFQAGVGFDQEPIPDRTRTPRIPGEDRTWIALGATYQPIENLTIALSYAHMFVKDASMNLSTDGVGNTFRGDLSGQYEGGIDIFGVQGSYRF